MKSCLACGASETRLILDFGLQPAANLLPEKPGAEVDRVRLALRFCDECGHSQQDEFFSVEELFGNYLYQSGTTKTLAGYFDWLADRLANEMPRGGTLLELASNDGSFLVAAAKAGITSTGVEPAHNLAELSRAQGLDVIEGYWPQARPDRKFDRVVAMNVLAHGPDPLAFLKGVADSLKPDGIAYVQVSQADMFRNFEFDTLYHEHFSFFCPSSLQAISRRAGFEAVRFCKTDIHGGSILALFGSNESPLDAALSSLLEGKFALGALDAGERPSAATADMFRQRATSTCHSVRSLADIARQAGMNFVFVGAAAKAITVLQASGVEVDAVLDEAPLKVGRYIPGTDVQIEPFSAAQRFEGSTLFVIGAWNFKTEIDNKLRALRGEGRDYSCSYFPTLTLSRL